MKSISILVPELAVAEAVSNPRYMFSAANQFYRQEEGTRYLMCSWLAKREQSKSMMASFR